VLISSVDGLIRVDYGFVNRSSSTDLPSKFHTRQLTFPILFTVYHTFEPHSLDLVRFERPRLKAKNSGKQGNNLEVSPKSSMPPTPRTQSFAVTSDDAFRSRMEDEADDGHCLASLSVRNVYGVPFEVTLERKGDGPGKFFLLCVTRLMVDDALSTSRLIPPGSTER
jgi:hypothetical protein